MGITVTLFALAGLFYVLGKAADVVVVNIRKTGERFGLSLFFLGILLGFFTSFPEFAVGINAFINDIPSVSVGNLFGGIVVLFGLILGTSAVINRSIKTAGKADELILLLAYLFLSLLLGVDGKISSSDGAVIVVAYVLILYYFLRRNRGISQRHAAPFRDGSAQMILSIVGGLLLVLLTSNIIVRFTIPLLERVHVPGFLVGLLVFSLGTNLPEIIVTVRSWRRHIRDLSISSLLGSAMTNMLILGLFAFMRSVPVVLSASYWTLMMFFFGFFMVLAYLFRSGNEMTRKEGFVLIACYAIFVISQIVVF